MSFFISVLHRVNFSVYSRSLSLCPSLCPWPNWILSPQAEDSKQQETGEPGEAWRSSLARLDPEHMPRGWGQEGQPRAGVLGVDRNKPIKFPTCWKKRPFFEPADP